MSRTIKIFGYRGLYSNTELIETKLVELGFKLSENPEVVVELCGLYEKSENFCRTLNYVPKKIYNLLDIDPNKDISFYSEAINHLNSADVITTISDFVRNDMITKLGLTKSIEVIYYPMKDIKYLNYLKTLSFIHVGRVLSENKRFDLAVETIKTLGLQDRTLIVVGPEKPRYGTYIPNVDDKLLNEVYNSAEFCFCLSFSEGLYLPAIEAVMGNCMPVLCSDLEVAYEWGLEDFMATPGVMTLHHAKSIAAKINEMHTNQDKYNKCMAELRPDFIDKFHIDNFVKRLYYLILNV